MVRNLSLELKNVPLKSKLTIACIFLIGLLGSLLIVYSTRWGPWVFSDSTGYIASARNLLAGHGLGLYGASGAFHPLTLHPPGFSLLLGFFGWIGFDLLNAARWINVILFGLTISVVGLTIFSVTHSSWLAIICSILILCMPDLVDIYSGAMSEPLFLFTGLLSISLVLWFLKNNRYSVLLAAAIAVALSIITRYTGFAFMLTGIIGLLFFSSRSWKHRVIDVLIYGSVGVLPVIGWQIWLKSQPGDDHFFQLVTNLGEQLANFRVSVMELVWSWLPFTSLLPRYSYNLAKTYLIIALVLLLILTSLSIWKLRKKNVKNIDSNQGLHLAGLLIVFTIVYLIILAFSYVYTLPTPDLINRTLLPMHLALLIGLFLLFYFMIQAWMSVKWLALVPILLALGISISYIHDTWNIASQYHQTGAGYTDRYWRDSETIRSVEQLPSNTTLISNESAAVLFYTNRPAYDISELTGDKSQSFTRFGDDPTDPAQIKFRDNGAALILFNTSLWQFKHLYYDQATKRMDSFTQGLYKYEQLEDGAIYFYNAPGK
jgi:hypothetical protein